MNVTETTKPVERTFTVELTEEEAKVIRNVFGNRSGADAERDGSPEGVEYTIFDALDNALVGNE